MLFFNFHSLFPVLVCVVFVNFLLRFKFFHKILPTSKNRYLSLDGIRGYLALLVFITHSHLTWRRYIDGSWGGSDFSITNYGRIGVFFFFVITGFLFTKKLLSSERVNWMSFFRSRLFRIYPLYIFALIIVTVVVFSSKSVGLVPVNELIFSYVKWILFYGGDINGFENTRLIIAGVTWTLRYEWFFYFILPACFWVLGYLRYIGFVFISVLSFYGFFFPIEIIPGISSKYLILFYIGFINACIVHYLPMSKFDFESKSISFISLLLIFNLFYFSHSDIAIIITGLLFFIICNGNSIFGFLKNDVSRFLGEISYSIYLLHGIVLYILFFYFDIYDISNFNLFYYDILVTSCSGLLVVFVCSFTYMFIERNSMRLLKKFNS